MKLKTYPVAWVVVPEGEAIYDEAATRIEIEDEAAGPFLRVTQCREDGKKGITLDIEQLTPLIAALDAASNVAAEIWADMEKSEKAANCEACDCDATPLREAAP